MVEYRYDAYGNITYQTPGTLSELNPYRYRGYRYDVESGLYYLQSRYYNPETGRFINADGLLKASDTVLGHNMFAYTENNPINNRDDSGYCSFSINYDFSDPFQTISKCGGSNKSVGAYTNGKTYYSKNQAINLLYSFTNSAHYTMTEIYRRIYIGRSIKYALITGIFTLLTNGSYSVALSGSTLTVAKSFSDHIYIREDIFTNNESGDVYDFVIVFYFDKKGNEVIQDILLKINGKSTTGILMSYNHNWKEEYDEIQNIENGNNFTFGNNGFINPFYNFWFVSLWYDNWAVI